MIAATTDTHLLSSASWDRRRIFSYKIHTEHPRWKIPMFGGEALRGVRTPQLSQWSVVTGSAVFRCMSTTHILTLNFNKSVQSNLGRGQRRGAVAHVRRKVPIGYNGAHQIRPQKYPFPWTNPLTPLPASSLGPVRPMIPNGIWIRSAVFPQCTGQTDRRTDRQIVHGKVWWVWATALRERRGLTMLSNSVSLVAAAARQQTEPAVNVCEYIQNCYQMI